MPGRKKGKVWCRVRIERPRCDQCTRYNDAPGKCFWCETQLIDWCRRWVYEGSFCPDHEACTEADINPNAPLRPDIITALTPLERARYAEMRGKSRADMAEELAALMTAKAIASGRSEAIEAAARVLAAATKIREAE